MKMKYNSFTTSKVLGLDIKGFGYDRKQKNPAGTGLMRGRDPDPGDLEEMWLHGLSTRVRNASPFTQLQQIKNSKIYKKSQ